MNIPQPPAEEMNLLIHFLAASGMLKDGTIARMNDTGKFYFEISERGVTALEALYPLLLSGPDTPNSAGVLALVWFLDDCQKKYRSG